MRAHYGLPDLYGSYNLVLYDSQHIWLDPLPDDAVQLLRLANRRTSERSLKERGSFQATSSLLSHST